MTSDTTGQMVQQCHTCGGGAPVDLHFCPQCTKLLTLGRHGDYFGFLGVERRLSLDPADLDRRFRTLSRQFHPDFFYHASSAERRASLERSSYLNDAYRTLRDPVSGIEYLLSIEGLVKRQVGSAPEAAEQGTAQIPVGLLEEVFALNEELDAARQMRTTGGAAEEWRHRLELARRPIETRRAEHEAQLQELSARWDALVDSGGAPDERRAVLESLRERMLERNYIANLLAGIERELESQNSEPSIL